MGLSGRDRAGPGDYHRAEEDAHSRETVSGQGV